MAKKTTKPDDGRRNTSLRLPKRTLKRLKICAIEEETSLQCLVERLIDQYLETR